MTSVKVTPIAFESLGARSMCTFIETPDVRILVDPGLSLGPRFALLPHPREYNVRGELRRKLREAADRADVFTVTHYHHDHYTPFFEEMVWIGSTIEEAETLYRGKRIIAKSYRSNVNPSQRRRGWFFWRSLSKLGVNCEVADGSTFSFGATDITFSDPVPHGEEDCLLGQVLMLLIERDDERILYTSDVQGPISSSTLRVAEKWMPQLAIVGGPPLYLKGYKISDKVVEKALDNMIYLTRFIPRIVLDHHVLRASDWRESLNHLYETADSNGCVVSSAAEYTGKDLKLLEYMRKDLYELEPPDQEFTRWSKLPREERRKTAPPI